MRPAAFQLPNPTLPSCSPRPPKLDLVQSSVITASDPTVSHMPLRVCTRARACACVRVARVCVHTKGERGPWCSCACACACSLCVCPPAARSTVSSSGTKSANISARRRRPPECTAVPLFHVSTPHLSMRWCRGEARLTQERVQEIVDKMIRLANTLPAVGNKRARAASPCLSSALGRAARAHFV